MTEHTEPESTETPALPRDRALLSTLGNCFLTWRRHLKRQIAPYDITLKQSHVLDRLQARDYLLPSEIADTLYSDRPTASLIINNLEKEGWVERHPDPEDGRQIRVVITERGKRKSAEVKRHVWQPLIAGFHPLSCFDASEIDQLEALIERLYAHLQHICDTD